MSKITKKQFLADVEHEVRMLKEHATKEELEKLDFYSFSPTWKESCIYGQMTGRCDTPRAKELMDKACVRILDFTKYTDGININDGDSFEGIKKYINGKYKGQTWLSTGRKYYYHSALEAYIYLKEAKVEHIINFLKGNIDTLSL